MHGCKRAILAVVVLAAALCAAAPAQARTGPCPQGDSDARCKLWTGEVTFVGDGDTLSVDLAGDHTKKPVRVRITGIQAMEEHVYTSVPEDRVGECHANEATARLEALVKAGKGRVQLAAQHSASHSGGRLRRAVSVKLRGTWRDVGRILLKDGHALWLANGSEWAWNRVYGKIAQQAATRRKNLWDPDYCGFGPPAKVRVLVNADPEGPDVDGEWVKVENRDAESTLYLGGWWVRDSALRRYVFPSGASVAPRSAAMVHVGSGTDTPPDFFWGLRGSVFDNPNPDRSGGDGAYLFDEDGDLRAAMQYPCRYRCTSAYKGALTIDPHPAGREYVVLRNTSGRPVNLEDLRLESKPQSYVFGPDSVIGPGEAMRVDVKGDPSTDTRLRKHWGLDRLILANGGDHVALTTLTFIRLGCASWGSASC